MSKQVKPRHSYRGAIRRWGTAWLTEYGCSVSDAIYKRKIK